MTALPARKPLKTGRTEAQVMAQVLEAARMLRIQLERRNTGMALNPKGRAVRFGTPGDSDLYGILNDGSGRVLAVEIKREGFDPIKLRGAKREHFDRQVARLRLTNEQGGVGFWVDDGEFFLRVLRFCLDGGRVEEPGDGKLILIAP